MISSGSSSTHSNSLRSILFNFSFIGFIVVVTERLVKSNIPFWSNSKSSTNWQASLSNAANLFCAPTDIENIFPPISAGPPVGGVPIVVGTGICSKTITVAFAAWIGGSSISANFCKGSTFFSTWLIALSKLSLILRNFFSSSTGGHILPNSFCWILATSTWTLAIILPSSFPSSLAINAVSCDGGIEQGIIQQMFF